MRCRPSFPGRKRMPAPMKAGERPFTCVSFLCVCVDEETMIDRGAGYRLMHQREGVEAWSTHPLARHTARQDALRRVGSVRTCARYQAAKSSFPTRGVPMAITSGCGCSCCWWIGEKREGTSANHPSIHPQQPPPLSRAFSVSVSPYSRAMYAPIKFATAPPKESPASETCGCWITWHPKLQSTGEDHVRKATTEHRGSVRPSRAGFVASPRRSAG